ncbi:MAG: murein biosynthesis integral membrane protein MurJ [Alphaproteobacteria bacterium]
MKKTESITTAAILLAFSILLSRILGYVRDMLLAYKFGASSTTDAFYAAFQIPDLLNYFLAGGALSIAFIPLYNRVQARDGDAAAHKLMATVLGTLGAVVIALTAVLWWKAEALIRFQFPNFDASTTELCIKLTRIVLPAQIFFVTGGIIQAVLLANRSFHAAAIAPLIYNACTILGGFLLYECCGIAGFAIGTLAGSFLGPFLMPLLYSHKHIPIRVRIALTDRNFLIYMAIAAPLMFGQTLLTLDEWYGRWFGALLASGTVAHLSFARRLMQVPIAVIGQAIGAAALPTLSKLWAEDKVKELNRVMLQTMQTSIALAVLAGAGFIALARPIVELVYEHGAFNVIDAEIVAILTLTLAFAVPGWIAQQIIVRAFYARGDTLRPMVLGTVLSILAIPLYMKLSETDGVKGLAYAGAIGMTVSAVATILYARAVHGSPKFVPLLLSLGSSLMIAGPSIFAAWAILRLRVAHLPLLDWHLKWVALFDLCLGGGVFAAIALFGIWLVGEEGMQDYLHKIIKRVFKLFK